jgi:hypothetical protein
MLPPSEPDRGVRPPIGRGYSLRLIVLRYLKYPILDD